MENTTSKPTFAELIQNSETPVLVDFYADWCQPCHMLKPILHEVGQNMEGQVKIIKIDVDRNPAASAKYQIRSIPTMMLFHKGQVKWRQSGVVPAHHIEQVIREAMAQ
ncbi:MAG: thioredoxin [Bacteroidia bacterium]|nr:thioredoxin [Bacteroidia bacterium]